MDVLGLQNWINGKIKSENLTIPLLKTDGIGGITTKSTFILLFMNKNPAKITDAQRLALAQSLGDQNGKRLASVAKTETSGSGWFGNGLPKILYERHYFWRFIGKTIPWLTLGMLADPTAGGYTDDADHNGISDSWDKLAAAAMINPDFAVESVSMGLFQVMGKWYKECGYDTPIDMLWDARQGEYGSYKMLVGFIKMSNLQKAFLAISTDPKTCVAYARGHNGADWAKNDYANKLANGMK